MRMYDGLLVIDADAHKMENPVVFFDYLDAPYRDRLASRTDRYGQPRLVVRDRDPRTGAELERVFPQPDGPGKGAVAAIHPETAIGGVFNRIRLEHMEREGVDAQVLYGSMTLSFESILDPELAVACMRAYNDYIADDCRPYAGRLFPVGYLSLADVGEAMKELRRCVFDLGMIGVHAPPSLPVPHPAAPDAFPMVRLPKHLSHPDFHPLLAAAAGLDDFLYEYRGLSHDPTDFFRRGQIFASFESDDPAPAYLREALGAMGEDVACFSADYGHWDGVLTDCVRNVARQREYAPEHLAKLLAGNCLRFYGRRLEAALNRPAA